MRWHFLVIEALLFGATACAAEPVSLFDGRSFAGWNGDTVKTWRIEDGTIVAGKSDLAAPRNEFLATDKEFENFELALEYKMDCTAGCNAGVQFRSKRVPNHHEVSGYQADIAPGITGALYDESRRNKLLVVPPTELQEKALALSKDGWHRYVIRCEDRTSTLSINGMELVSYTEADDAIPLKGMIALQIHGGLTGTIRYRNITITELPSPGSGADANAPLEKMQVADGISTEVFASPQ